MADFLWTRPDQSPKAVLLLAHGAGAAMDSSFMNRLSNALAAHGIATARFEFGYMAKRREGGSKAPPPKADKLTGEFQTALQKLLAEMKSEDLACPVLIGGKSMGGRVAAMLAGGNSLPSRVRAVACYGYPFHPTGQSDAPWRMEPLEQANRPVLILQGERDPFGNREELEGITLPEKVSVTYLEDGNHDFGPRGQSPATLDSNVTAAAAATAEFVSKLAEA